MLNFFPAGLFTRGEFQIAQSKIIAEITTSAATFKEQSFRASNMSTNRLLHIPTRAIIEDRPDGHPGISESSSRSIGCSVLLLNNKEWHGQEQRKRTSLNALGIVSTSAYLAHPKNGTACSSQSSSKQCGGSIASIR